MEDQPSRLISLHVGKPRTVEHAGKAWTSAIHKTLIAERLFLDSLSRTRSKFAETLRDVARGQPRLSNINLDTGRPAAAGQYPLADETVKELQKKLASASATRARSR